jgi:hypothetical protein
VAERTWEARELQLLEAIAESEREHDENVGNAALAERTGLPDEEVEWGLKALHEADPPFITGIEAGACLNCSASACGSEDGAWWVSGRPRTQQRR